MKVKTLFISLIVIFTQLALANNRAELLPFFKDSYEECQKNFDEIIDELQKENKKIQRHAFTYSEGIITSYFVPTKNKKSKSLLVLISGTHGIEAFAGSAVQRYILKKKSQSSDLLLVHGLNLYGFKNFRRVNENNVDLNRNFILDRVNFVTNDSGYSQLESFLNPKEKANVGFLHPFLFFTNSLFKIIRHSMTTLRESIVKGQYTYSDGIFYGGKSTEIQEQLLQQISKKFIHNYEKVFIADIHTGYGEKGTLHLLSGHSEEKESQDLLRIFEEREIDFGNSKNFYTVTGEMLKYLMHLTAQHNKHVFGVTFEYGTLDSQGVLGSVESLRRMVLENQNFHYPSDNLDSSNKIKNLYKEMFYPSDLNWRVQILNQTDAKIEKVFKFLERE